MRSGGVLESNCPTSYGPACPLPQPGCQSQRAKASLILTTGGKVAGGGPAPWGGRALQADPEAVPSPRPPVGGRRDRGAEAWPPGPLPPSPCRPHRARAPSPPPSGFAQRLTEKLSGKNTHTQNTGFSPEPLSFPVTAVSAHQQPKPRGNGRRQVPKAHGWVPSPHCSSTDRSFQRPPTFPRSSRPGLGRGPRGPGEHGLGAGSCLRSGPAARLLCEWGDSTTPGLAL